METQTEAERFFGRIPSSDTLATKDTLNRAQTMAEDRRTDTGKEKRQRKSNIYLLGYPLNLSALSITSLSPCPSPFPTHVPPLLDTSVAVAGGPPEMPGGGGPGMPVPIVDHSQVYLSRGVCYRPGVHTKRMRAVRTGAIPTNFMSLSCVLCFRRLKEV